MSTTATPEKKLWGTPLKLKQAEERIKELEALLAVVQNSVENGQCDIICEPNELQVLIESENTTLKSRIKELEAENQALREVQGISNALPPLNLDEAYQFEVWQRDGDTKFEKKGNPVRWRHFHHDPSEWVYHEKLNFWADSGYSTSIIERAQAMVANAFGGVQRADGSGTMRWDVRYARLGPEGRDGRGQPTGESTYENLPPFDKDNVIEVIVRIRKP